MKIKLEKEKIENLTNDEKTNENKVNKVKKYSFFKIFAIILLTLLVIAIIVETIYIIVLNDKINKMQQDIDNIPEVTSESLTVNHYENIEYTPSNNLIIWFS